MKEASERKEQRQICIGVRESVCMSNVFTLLHRKVHIFCAKGEFFIQLLASVFK